LTVLANTVLQVVFIQVANLEILAMVLWGAWRMDISVNVFGDRAQGSEDLRLDKIARTGTLSP